MLGIYYAEIITSAIALAVFGTMIHRLRLPADTRWVWLAAAVVLPLQPLAFYLIRVPLDHWAVAHLGATSTAYQWLITLYAPLTEEPAKLVPLLIPVIFRDIRRENFARYALAIGLGFALGEMWFIAHRVAQNAELARLPFYQFGGYLSERFMTCILHSAFVSVALWRLRRGFAWGILGAMALHWAGNFPIFLMSWNIGGLGRPFWTVAIQLWLAFYFLGAIGLLAFFAYGRFDLGKLFYGRRKCPGCGEEYDAPLLALNFGPTRYERCPHCRRWHWTKASSATASPPDLPFPR